VSTNGELTKSLSMRKVRSMCWELALSHSPFFFASWIKEWVILSFFTSRVPISRWWSSFQLLFLVLEFFLVHVDDQNQVVYIGHVCLGKRISSALRKPLMTMIIIIIKFSTTDNAILAFWLVHFISVTRHYTFVWPYMEMNASKTARHKIFHSKPSLVDKKNVSKKQILWVNHRQNSRNYR